MTTSYSMLGMIATGSYHALVVIGFALLGTALVLLVSALFGREDKR